MLTDPLVRFVPRAVDQRWGYAGSVPVSVTGFNPFRREIYFSPTSQLALWLESPDCDPRDLNFSDRLMREVFFALHDYLHAWAYAAIYTLAPGIGAGCAAITEERFEDFVFIHLVTEAVATVGLDYWYLCTNAFDADLFGSRVRGLTVAYHERHTEEYRRFNKSFDPQRPEFFGEVVRQYCEGRFEGFTADDAARSVLLYTWMNHELEYGARQREITRRWLAFLAPERIELGRVGAPVSANRAWQHELVKKLGQMLWEKVKEDRLHELPAPCERAQAWHSPGGRVFDSRFTNLARATPRRLRDAFESAARAKRPERFACAFYQWVAMHDCEDFDPALTRQFSSVLKGRDWKLALAMFQGARRVPRQGGEPRDLLMLN